MFKDLLKRIFNYRFHVIGMFNPFINAEINSIGNYQGVTDLKREIPVIVSLTSYRDRFDELPLTIFSLLNQNLKPDRIILWLDEETEDLQTVPYSITRFIKNGLEIRFVKDIGPYTKAIYAFKEFYGAVIVTADDDIYYPKDWFKKLYVSYLAHPEDIQVHRAHKVDLSLPYEKWIKGVNEENARFDNFITGVGGSLYPPKCFTSEVFREDIFLKCTPCADDIWFWTMALLKGRKIRVVKNHNKTLICTNILKHIFAKTLYKENRKGGNDRQLACLMKYYGENILARLK